MSTDPILDEIRALLRDRLALEGPVGRESSLAGDLALDSVQLLELVVELENAFQVALEPEPGEPLETVGQVVAWIERCRAARGEAA
jgi:acyl carrier protein